MSMSLKDTYRGWTISVTAGKNKCANFSFDIAGPSGYTQHVSMGGENENRAVERAKEMIDMEIALADDQ